LFFFCGLFDAKPLGTGRSRARVSDCVSVLCFAPFFFLVVVNRTDRTNERLVADQNAAVLSIE
jgi:hypothetical protein